MFEKCWPVNQLNNPDTIVKLLFLLLYLVLLFSAAHYGISTANTMGLITFFVFILIFFYRPTFSSRYEFYITFAAIIIVGTAIRLYLAFCFYGNYDMESYDIVSDLVLHGQNVYNETARYNYSPIWFTILGILKVISSGQPFHFAVRTFLTCIDLFTLLVLVSIARLQKISYEGLITVALLFYLNPVSYLISGYHGQFDNLALLFILIGIYLILTNRNKSLILILTSWLAFSTGLIIKHIVLGHYLTGINNLMKKNFYRLLALLATLLLFLMSFFPYWATGSGGIVRNVFLYGAIPKMYGVSSVVNLPVIKYVFIAGLFVYPFFIENRDLITQFLLVSLFFLAFTTGIGIQFFILPIAFGALRQSWWFFLYSFTASVVLLGSGVNMGLAGFSAVTMNAVWIVVLFWFVFLHFNLQIKQENSVQSS